MEKDWKAEGADSAGSAPASNAQASLQTSQ
jgi:hypothetical protein